MRITPFFAVLLVASVRAANDATLQPEAKGAEVVEMTVDKIEASCVFPEDKLLLRRLAYVESNDGLHPDAFRKKYHGGIWQVDEAMLQTTQASSANVVLLEYIKGIQASFGIDWPSVTWEDLRKPLYSALGARMYILYNSRNDPNGIPRDIEGQATFWCAYYRPAGDEQDYIAAANALEKGCSKPKGPDMVFLIDGSGSIGMSDFNKIKRFMQDVVGSYEVGGEGARFSVIKYSTSVRREFDLNKYQTKNDILAAIDRISYQGGGTNTHLGLAEMRTAGFSEANGARPITSGHPRVALVLTDGRSNEPPKTVIEALKVHDDDITVFAVGVGSSVDLNELEVIASDPLCIHLFLLSGFNEIEALKSAIEKRTCDAPVIVGPGRNGTEVNGTIPGGGDQNCKIRIGADGVTVKIVAWTGSANYYISQTTYPSESFYDRKITSISSTDVGVMFITKPDSEDEEVMLFCNIKGDPDNDTDVGIGIVPGDKDYCNPNPCKNGANCTDTGSGYVCVCAPGFTGSDCSSEIDQCKPNPCQNGKCSNGNNGTVCICDAGYTGEFCENDVDECASNPCQNNATCVDGENKFTCKCPPGYEGVLCDREVDNCHSNPCKHGSCVSNPGGFVCQCPPGFTGSICDSEIDNCASKPCVRGTCRSSQTGYVCTCKPGFTGVNCDVPINECASNPCKNGDCQEINGGYECCCDEGWTGEHCEIDIDECASNPCVNGQCHDGDNKYTCECECGFTGVHCEIDIDECASNPCHKGECYDKVCGYVCTCMPGWTGPNCDVDIDECASNPCVNGDCVDGENRFDCVCLPGWTGPLCDIDIDECESNPCIHGTCKDGINRWDCECDPGYTGVTCDIDIDECASNPCIHGECEDGINRWECHCLPGFTGVNCETEIDECASNPCVNGQCQDDINMYKCICDAGWTGVNCDIDIDECESNPCVNGKCKDKVNGYICICDVFYTGTHCDCPIDNCASNPCKNGVCENSISGWECICNSGYGGATCEEKPSVPPKKTTKPPSNTKPPPVKTTKPPNSGVYNCDDNNPCTPENAEKGQFYFPHEDPTEFVQCSEWGQCHIMSCGPGTVWNPDILNCVHA